MISTSFRRIVETFPSVPGRLLACLLVFAACNKSPADQTDENSTSKSLGDGWFGTNLGRSADWSGTSFFEGDTLTVSGGGGDFGEGGDDGHFVYQKVSGDFDLIARVSDYQGDTSDPKAKAVLAFKEGEGQGDEGEPSAGGSGWYQSLNYGGEDQWYRRNGMSIEYFSSADVNDEGQGAYLRLTRVGNAFRSYHFEDGLGWVPHGDEQDTTMSTDGYLGLGATNGTDAGELLTVHFSDIKLVSAPMAVDLSKPVVSDVLVIPTHDSATVQWSTNEMATGIVKYGLSADGENQETTTTLAVGHSVELADLAAATTYYYQIVASDTAGNTTVDHQYSFVTESTPDTQNPTIDGVSATSTHNTATIQWSTDEMARGLVEYGRTDAYGNQIEVSELAVQQVGELIGLMPEVTYFYRVTATDSSGNASEKVTGSFITQSPPDTTPPLVSAVTENSTHNTATLGWATNEEAAGGVEYGTSPAYGSRVAVSTPALVQSVSISGLEPSQTYYYRITASDASGNLSSGSTGSFVTEPPPDLTAPVISGLTATPTHNQATVAWSTDERASAQVEYGTTTAYGGAVNSSTLLVGQSLVLPNLNSSQTYYYRVTATDASGNRSTGITGSFVTTPPPDTTAPVISAVTTTPADDAATIGWRTSEIASGRVEYGLTTAYGSEVLTPMGASPHSIQLTALTPSTTYYFRISVSDASGNTRTDSGRSFVTAPLQGNGPVISNIVVTEIALHSARVSWTTDVPATTEIDYDLNGWPKDVRDFSLKKSHSVVVDGLMAGMAHTYVIVAEEGGGEVTTTPEASITTTSYAGNGLPAGWSSVDIGVVSTTMPGSATFDPNVDGGSFVVRGTGTDVFYDADSFHFVHHPVDGDFVFTLRVANYSGYLHQWTKAMTMFRVDLDADSKMFNQSINYAGNDWLYYREVKGNNHVEITNSQIHSGTGAPLFARLTRVGNTFWEEYSEDGIAWAYHGPSTGTTVSGLPSAGYVGFGVCSKSNSFLSEIVYSDVSVVVP